MSNLQPIMDSQVVERPSDIENTQNNNNPDTACVKPSRKRTKVDTKNRSNKKQITNQLLRLQGKEYQGKRRTPSGLIPIVRKARSIGPACTSNKCRQSTRTRFCHLFTEEVREITFKHFWNESWETRKSYVVSLIDATSSKKRRREVLNTQTRQVEYKYHLRLRGVRYQVCQIMFLNTLGLKHGTIKHWTKPLKQEMESQLSHPKEITALRTPRRRRNPAHTNAAAPARMPAADVATAGPSQQEQSQQEQRQQQEQVEQQSQVYLPEYQVKCEVVVSDEDEDEDQPLQQRHANAAYQEPPDSQASHHGHALWMQRGEEPSPASSQPERMDAEETEQHPSNLLEVHLEAGLELRLTNQIAELMQEHRAKESKLEASLAAKTAECCRLQAELQIARQPSCELSGLKAEVSELTQELADLSRAYAKMGVKQEATTAQVAALTCQLAEATKLHTQSQQRCQQLSQQLKQVQGLDSERSVEREDRTSSSSSSSCAVQQHQQHQQMHGLGSSSQAWEEEAAASRDRHRPKVRTMEGRDHERNSLVCVPEWQQQHSWPSSRVSGGRDLLAMEDERGERERESQISQQHAWHHQTLQGAATESFENSSGQSGVLHTNRRMDPSNFVINL